LADELGIAFDRSANEALKGIDREGSLARLLAMGGITLSGEQAEAALAAKNERYRHLIEDFGPQNTFEGVRPLLERARAQGIKIGLASASRNAPFLLRKLGIETLFDHVGDPTAALPKPAPDLFLSVAKALGLQPAQCIGIEDAVAGVAAIKAAGMTAIGLGDPQALAQADRVFDRLGDPRLFRAVLATDP
jgi:beta-phosphoglucomutase